MESSGILYCGTVHIKRLIMGATARLPIIASLSCFVFVINVVASGVLYLLYCIPALPRGPYHAAGGLRCMTHQPHVGHCGQRTGSQRFAHASLHG